MWSAHGMTHSCTVLSLAGWTPHVWIWINSIAFYYCVFDWNRWQLLSRQDPIYIIGLSEAKYDYYWVYVTNKDHEIHFASCALDVSLESKFRKYTFNKGELRDIRKTMIEYFQNHPEETLIISKFNENPEEEDYYIENVY